jgi:hypothetical protein
MKKYALALSILMSISACTSTPARGPAAGMPTISRDRHPTTNLDSKFETAWHSETEELNVLEKIGDVNNKFIGQANARYRQWSAQTGQKPKRTDEVLHALPQRPNGQFATRAVHKKNHGCYPARVTFNDRAPDQGLFTKGAEYDAIIRFSNGSQRNLPDSEFDSRGMALKLLPAGFLNAPRFDAASANASTVLNIANVNFPVPFMFNPDEYLEAISVGLQEFSAPNEKVIPLAEQFWLLKELSLRSRVLAGTLASTVILNPLHQTYHSMVAYRLGAQNDENRTAVKYIFAPCTSQTGDPAWTQYPVRQFKVGHGWEDLSGFTFAVDKDYKRFVKTPAGKRLMANPDFLREAAQNSLKAGGTCFDFQIQSYLDAENTPVEDPTEIWLENEAQRTLWQSRFAGMPANAGARPSTSVAKRAVAAPVTIARIQINQLSQTNLDQIDGEEFKTFCEDLSFNTWDNVPEAHKPLGVVARMRWSAYRSSVNTRHQINGVGGN